MNKQNKIIYFIISLIFFIVFDVFFSNLAIRSRFGIQENSVFDIIYVQNTGAAFSIFENSQMFLIVFAIAAILAILAYGLKNAEKFSVFAVFWCALLLSGIMVNLYERLNFGYVRDFIMLKFIDFPIFNISDVFITVGVAALVVLIIKNKYIKR